MASVVIPRTSDGMGRLRFDPVSSADGAFTVRGARYAKGKVALSVNDNSGSYKGRTARLADAMGFRWVNREKAYLGSPKQAETLARAYARGDDAKLGTTKRGTLGYVLEKTPPAPAAPTAAKAPRGLSGAYQRNGIWYGTVLGEPTEVRPGSKGDPYKFKSSYFVDGPRNAEGYPVAGKKINAATMKDYTAAIRAHKSQDPGWKPPGGKKAAGLMSAKASAGGGSGTNADGGR